MRFLSTAVIFAIVASERAVVGFPYAYPAFSSYISALPYLHPASAPLLHAAPAYYPHMAYPFHELQNVAGAARKESDLLTDVAVRFPMRAN